MIKSILLKHCVSFKNKAAEAKKSSPQTSLEGCECISGILPYIDPTDLHFNWFVVGYSEFHHQAGIALVFMGS
jgi:hypothetical protein